MLRPIPVLNSICATTLPQRMLFGSGITVWQVPSNIYSQVSVSYTELEEKIGGTSKLADYLISQMVEWNRTYWPEPIESRPLGDSPAISLMLYPAEAISASFLPRFGQEGHYLPGSGIRSASSSRSTSGSCLKTCSPRSANLVGVGVITHSTCPNHAPPSHRFT